MVSCEANATNKSGGEAEIAGGGQGDVWGRDAEFTEHSRGGSQRSAAQSGCTPGAARVISLGG
jgi:hypothetical protein